jgi:hypothetical protein
MRRWDLCSGTLGFSQNLGWENRNRNPLQDRPSILYAIEILSTLCSTSCTGGQAQSSSNNFNDFRGFYMGHPVCSYEYIGKN